MAIEQRNRPLLNRKEFQQMGLLPIATAAAHFFIDDKNDIGNIGMLVTSNTVAYLYHHDEDGFVQIPSPALAGTFGAGACGTFSPWSATITANGGSTTTITVAAGSFNLTGVVVGKTVEILTGSAGAQGQRRVITRMLNNAGTGTITLTVNQAFGAAIANTNTLRISSGRFYALGAGTLAAGSFRVFDVATQAWASLSQTGLPGTWGTDGRMVLANRVKNLHDTGTLTAGSTTVATNLAANGWTVDKWKGYWLNIIDGTGEGQCGKILSNTTTAITLVTAFGVAMDATSVYEIRDTGGFAFGTATAGAASTLTNSGKAWTTNQWTNYQVRIVSGTGIGQIRLIASNTATVLTTGSAWTTNPDTTSVYEIEGDENSIYLIGNAAVTMYKYSISATTWATVSPGGARGGAPAAGATFNWIPDTANLDWSTENAILDGRYIYSFRGGAVATLDRYDIAGNTWAAITYIGTETFTTGSGAAASGRYIYIRKDATNRYFKFSVTGNYLEPVATNFFPDGAALIGDRVWVKNFDPDGQIKWLYGMMNTGTVLHRIMLY